MDELFPFGRHPKRVLNEMKWRGLDLDDVELEILHRGAPSDRIRARASEITLGRSFFTYMGTEIPYHRIERIVYRGRTVFSRADIVRGQQSSTT
ncbi:MAG: DUF504 domain-containing protein [Methanothrix sp.]|nr:RNA repair domain-containing protein [Methanothrix sp.]HOK58892.1 RNA repair domain-containing protein [Methanothrix sp.]HOL44184.1 RNA repair domain-containing protein [Methanothrix sp.]HPO89153.1 RNA repair domain-containing protein [Methanothrix sp.]